MSNDQPLTIHRTHHDAPSPTRRSCEVALRLGFTIDRAAPKQPAPITIPLTPGRVVAVTGASGAGKTTLLKDLARAAADAGWRTVHIAPKRWPNKPCVDLVGRDLDRALRALALAGLAEAFTLLRRPRELSEGQRWRLLLAAAFDALPPAGSDRRTLLIIDEFASSLDDTTARSVASLLERRLVASSAAAAIATREPVAAALNAARLLRLRHDGEAEHVARDGNPSGPRFRIAHGDRADLQRLAHLHYRPGSPATIDRVMSARDTSSGELAGVLVTSRPVLTAAWRAHAWPGVFDVAPRRRAAGRVNARLRCISRVIVDPRFRGLGLARRLVQHYLRRPATPHTEAIAAMGNLCPFFERAGMTAYPLTPPRRVARLLDALDHAGIEPWRLATPRLALDRAARAGHTGFLERELRLWARSTRAAARLASGPLPRLAELACAAATPPIAYAHTAR